MDIGRRVLDAITDIEGLLIEGKSVQEALSACSQDYELKTNVLEHRARKALGDLETVRDRSTHSANEIGRQHRAETAIEAYLVEKPEPNYSTWFENRVGRVPTKSESKDFNRRYAEFSLRDIRFEI